MSRPMGDDLLGVLDQLVRVGCAEAEVFAKEGRSRTLTQTTRRQVAAMRKEQGWAVRAGDDRSSFFYANSGQPSPDTPWPTADGQGLRLPSPQPIPAWSPPSDLDAPLIGENEARALFRGIERALDSELPGARLLHAALEDGTSEARLVSSREVRAAVRQRAASLYLEALGPGAALGSVSLQVANREARRFHPVALARRLADRLLVAQKGRCPPRDRGEFLLAPPVGARLLAALQPLWIGPDAAKHAAPLTDQRGRLGSEKLSVIDNGRLVGGLAEAPVDGEGLPTREVRLVDGGRLAQPLLAWWQSTTAPRQAAGCSVRHGWRDLPTPGATHLFIAPDPATTVADLLAAVTRGYYILDLEGAPRIDLKANRFALPVCGFGIDAGRAVDSVTGAWLTGSIRTLLSGILATARDLTFLPIRGLIGAPTILVRGLELRRKP